nr:MAG: metalloendopeptidase [Acidobacteriota bacterium]
MDDRLRDAVDVIERHGVDVLDDLVGRELLPEVVFLPRDAGHAAHRRLQRQQDRSLEVQLRRYAHLDHYADGLKEGAPVRRGQVLGYVGSTGDASPDAPHLHFSIFRLTPEKQWWRGEPINPFGLLGR